MLTEISIAADTEGDIEEVIRNIQDAPKMRSVLFELTANLGKRIEWHIDANPEISPYDVKEYVMEQIFDEITSIGLTEKNFE